MYAYDPAGNRTSEQIDDQLTGATYDVLNRLASQQPAGAMTVEGTVNESAVVTVQGKPAVLTPDGRFTTTTPVVTGTNTVAITATDPTGNTATRQYEVDSTAAGRTFTYDANGNMTSDGTMTFAWDARNQLVKATRGLQTTEFVRDGYGRDLRVTERYENVVRSNRDYVWCGVNRCQVNDGATGAQFFAYGQRLGSDAHYYVTDHLRQRMATLSRGLSSGKMQPAMWSPTGSSTWLRKVASRRQKH